MKHWHRIKGTVKTLLLIVLFVFLVILFNWWGVIIDICILFYILTKDGFYFWEG